MEARSLSVSYIAIYHQQISHKVRSGVEIACSKLCRSVPGCKQLPMFVLCSDKFRDCLSWVVDEPLWLHHSINEAGQWAPRISNICLLWAYGYQTSYVNACLYYETHLAISPSLPIAGFRVPGNFNYFIDDVVHNHHYSCSRSDCNCSGSTRRLPQSLYYLQARHQICDCTKDSHKRQHARGVGIFFKFHNHI